MFPLRERQEDISFLARHYLNLFSEKFGKRKILLELEAEKYLGTYPWPGNVRELVNLCERIAALSEGEVISREEIQVLLGKQKDALKTDPVSMKSPERGNSSPCSKLFEGLSLIRAMEQSFWGSVEPRYGENFGLSSL
jgi:DNA-binding NtrC family response regulator